MKLENPEVRIETTNRCNAKCIMCPRDQMTRVQTTMPMDHFKDLVMQSKKLHAKLISPFGYGEPFMDKGIIEKVKFCSVNNLDTFITTNGSMVTQDKAKAILEAGLSHIRFSFHAVFPHDYETTHIGLKWADTMRNILNFIELRNTKYKRCKISMTCMPLSGESAFDFKKLWLKQVDWLEIWKPHNWIDSKPYRMNHNMNDRRSTCGRPARGPVQINADGKIMVCCFDTDAKMIIGDTYKNSIEEIITGPRLAEIRRIHENDANLNDSLPCHNCDQLNKQNYLMFSSRDEEMKGSHTSSLKFGLTIPRGGRVNKIKEKKRWH